MRIRLMPPSVAALGLALGLLTGCNDDLSNIGESVQTTRDVVGSEQYNLQFKAETVAAPTAYNGFGTAGLLGAYADAAYGSFSADFVTQLRTAPGFTFSEAPAGGQIDSVELRLIFAQTDGYVGSAKAPMQISVYEMPLGYSGADYSVTSLSAYADEDRLLGERTIRIEKDSVAYSYNAASQAKYISIKLKNELGQRLYNASVNNSSYFETQQAFNQNLLGGLYVTVSTGRGAVIKVLATRLVIHSHHLNSEGKEVKDAESFLNTKLTAHADGISNEVVASLLAPNSDYVYSKGPAGVQAAIILPRAQMQRLLANQPSTTKIGTNWTLADTQMNLTVDNPSDLKLNPPRYMMLMPKDSVKTYFERGMTERTRSATSYLSTPYSISSAHYNFYNISRMLTEHLKRHASYSGGVWVVDADLELRLVPVERVTSRVGNSSSSAEVTSEIHEYLFPSFVRLKKNADALKIGVVATIFNR